MQTTKFIWFNGKLVPWDEAKIHVLTHTLHYGGGTFEGIRFYKTSQGSAIFRLKDHVERLFYSANALKMPLKYTREEVTAAIIEVGKVNGLEEGYIRPLLYYGYGKMGVSPVGAPVDFAVACWPWDNYLGQECIDVKTSQFIRIHPHSTIVDAKLCGHYLNSILASLELQGTHYHEALLLDSEGYISEGPGENFFMVKNAVLYTPKLGTILPGITRDTVLKLAKEKGLVVQETDITLEEALQADETFFTGTAAEITPIRSINDRAIGDGDIGPITRKIKEAYTQIIHGKDPNFKDFLTLIPKAFEI
jgi:branched-chain amino acid aminotransferase